MVAIRYFLFSIISTVIALPLAFPDDYSNELVALGDETDPYEPNSASVDVSQSTNDVVASLDFCKAPQGGNLQSREDDPCAQYEPKSVDQDLLGTALNGGIRGAQIAGSALLQYGKYVAPEVEPSAQATGLFGAAVANGAKLINGGGSSPPAAAGY